MRKTIIMGLPALLLALCAGAQDSTKTTMLQEVAVSAARTEQPIIEIPRSVSVITRQTIENSVYQSFGELLNMQTGLYVVGANQTPGTNQNIFMRGANSNQVAVMIDGVRVTDPSSPNSAIDLSELSLADVERVEVTRGSHSTLSGGAAIGGVINIITKNNGMAGFHGRAALQGGTFGKGTSSATENLDVGYTFKNGLYFNGGVFQQNVNGLDASEKNPAAPSFTSDKDDFEKTDAILKAGFKNRIWNGSITFRNGHQNTDIDNGAFLDDDNNYLTFDRRILEYHVGYLPSGRWHFSLLGSLSSCERFYENDSSKISETEYDRAYSRGTYFGDLQTHELQINYRDKMFRGVFGAGLYFEKMSFDNYFFYNDPSYPFEVRTNYDTLDTQTRTQYIFGQLNYGRGIFNISVGSRLSHHSTFGNFATLELNPSVTWKDWLLYGSVSSGYNAPSLYQLFDPTKNFGAYTTRGNRKLGAEQSLSLEAGIKKEFASGSYVTVSAYQTTVDNSIEYIYLWNGSKSIADLDFSDDRGDTYINVASQQVTGLELEGFISITDKLSLKGNATVLQGKIKVRPDDADKLQTGDNHVQLYNLGTFLDQDVQQSDLVRRPGFVSLAQVRYALRSNLSVEATHRYTGRRFDSGYDGALGPYGALKRIEVEAYHLVDFGVHWQATNTWAIGLKIENVLNEKYHELAGFHTRGRSGYLKLTARW